VTRTPRRPRPLRAETGASFDPRTILCADCGSVRILRELRICNDCWSKRRRAAEVRLEPPDPLEPQLRAEEA
jgi:hypothetical protein